MLTALMIICGLIWLSILLYGIKGRGLIILLIWLFVAPVVLNLVETGSRGLRASAKMAEEKPIVQKKSYQVRKNPFINSRDDGVRIDQLFEPHRVMMAAFLVVFLFDVLLGRKRLAFDRTEICIATFSVILLASAIFSANRLEYSLRVATDAFVVNLLAYFITRRLVTTEEQFRKLIQVVGYLGFYLIIMVSIERLVQPKLLHRVMGPFPHRDLLFVVMTVVFFVVLADHLGWGKFARGKPALPRGVRMLLVYLTPVVVFLTWTRGNWLGFALGVWVFLALGFRLLNFPRKLGTAVLVLLLGPILIVAWQALVPEEARDERVAGAQNVYARLASWQTTVGEFAKHPILGIGLNNVREALARSSRSRTRVAGQQSLRSVHNSFLAMLAELGAVGFLAYLGIVVSIIQMGLLLYRKGPNPEDRWRGVAVVSIMVAYLAPALFSNLLYTPAVSHSYVFAFVGAIAGLYDPLWRRRPGQYVRKARVVKDSLMIPNPSGL